MKELTGEHAFVHENMAAYLAGGLDGAERARFDGHVNGCPECFDALSEARDADRGIQRALADLVPAEGLEGRVVEGVRRANRWRHPAIRRMGYATAAAVALAATGVFANVAMRQDGRFNNPLTRSLVSNADAQDTDWGKRNESVTGVFVKGQRDSRVLDELAPVASSRGSRGGGDQIAGEKMGGASLGGYVAIRQQKVAQLLTDAQKLYQETQFKEAADLLRQATIIDPKDTNAALMLRLVVDKISDRAYEEVMHRTGQEVIRQEVDSTEHLIPYADLLVYPDNWPEITRKRVEGSGPSTAPASFDESAVAWGATSKDSRNSTPAGQPGGGRFVTSFDQKMAYSPAPPVAPQDVGGTALTYNRSSKRVDDIGFEFGTNPALPQNLDIKNNGLIVGTDAGSDFRISGTGALTKTDADKLALLGVNGYNGTLYAGGLSINGGTLTVSGASNSYTGATNVGGGGLRSVSGRLDTTLIPASQGSPNALDSPVSHAIDIVDASDFEATKGLKIDANGKSAANWGKLNDQGKNLEGNQDSQGRFSLGAGLEKNDAPANGNVLVTAGSSSTGIMNSHVSVMSPEAQEELTLRVSPQGTRDLRWQLDSDAMIALAGPNAPALATPGSAPSGGGSATGTATPPENSAPPPEIQALKIIRNGTISFEVLSFDDAYQRVRQIASIEKGYVSSTSSDKLANGHVRGTIVVRIPPEHLDTFLISLRSLGDLKAQQIGAADVTKDYYDIQAELRGLAVMEGRLLDLIKNGKGEVKDLIEAEKQLGDTRVRMEKLQGEISYYNNLVSLATITITAYEKDIASPTAASEQENVNVNVESEEVEAKYQQARKIFEDVKGHIVESKLTNADADHVAAHIVADVPPAQADFVANQLKQLGKVASYNRDRRQTTSGGTGAPMPGVQVEEKDTHFTVDLFNLANLNPRETTVLNVAVKDVEASYKATLALIKQPVTEVAPPAAPAGAPAPAAPAASGRVLASNLTGQQSDQMYADINAQVRSENADAVLAALRSAGMVLTSQLNTNQDQSGTTAAKRGIQVRIVSIAMVNPKEADTLTIAVSDVDAAYKQALALIRKDAPPPAAGAPDAAELALLPATVGRVTSAATNGDQPLTKQADVSAQIRSDQDADLLTALKKLGEVINSKATENQDNVGVTRAKRGLAVHFVNVANVLPGELQQLHAVSANVADSYKSLNAALQDMAGRGEVRIVNARFSDDPRTETASLAFEAQKTSVPALEKAFAAAGLEFSSRTVSHPPDSSVALDSKVMFQIDNIASAESLDPKRTVVMGIEVDDVDQTLARLRAGLASLNNGPASRARESDFTVSRDKEGMVTATLKIDTYLATTPAVLANLQGLGTQTSYQESRNPNAAETRTFTKERVELTLSSHKPLKPIVAADAGLGSSARAALTSALGALFLALYYVLTGLLFVAPFVLIAWPIWWLMKRRKAAKA